MHEVEVIRANRKISDRAAGKTSDILRVAPYARVSTDTEEQLSSYKSQVAYYTDLVQKRPDWVLVDIYADEAITGTQITKRENFQRMINDCMDGKIDMIITKSISRFARNTLDTLKYVRMLKERNIAVFFEDENINTLTMDGELLLVILSSVAQQEVENISANVKKGLKMKMRRGELVGFVSCLGYDYDPTDKSISVNETEAGTVRYIFERYIEGAGAYVIAKELMTLGHKTKLGNSEWHDTAVLGIIKNEKYKGDVLQGKSFTVDPISKRRLENYGEEDQFYIRNHHEPIISEEVFEKAQAILKRRGSKLRKGVKRGKREKYSRKYAFSSKLECAFCGSNLSRRNWHSGTDHEKVIWQCVTATKKGKKYCPSSKAIPEKLLEDAFVESYRLLCDNNSDVLDELVKRMESVLRSNDLKKRLAKAENEIHTVEQKRDKLINMHLEGIIDKIAYEKKYEELEHSLGSLVSEKERLEQSAQEAIDLEKRIVHFRRVLEQNEVLSSFDRCVFESIVDKVIVGEVDDDGNVDPYKLTFVYKTGFINKVKSKMHKQIGKKRCENDKADVHSYSLGDTCGVHNEAGKGGQVNGRLLSGTETGPYIMEIIMKYTEAVKIGDTYLLSIISELYGLEGYEFDMIKAHEGGRNIAYRCKKGGAGAKIIRISFLDDRSRDDLLGEVEYIRYLYENGASVSDVASSRKGNLLEGIINHGHRFFICVFEKARGKMLGENNYQYREGVPITEYYYNCGKVLGKMHQLSKGYTPVHRRYSFSDKYNPEYIDSLIPDSLSLLKEKIAALLKALDGLDKDRESFGMVHFDYSDGNYMIDFDTGRITVFDFDNACFCWYMYDLANIWAHGVGWIQFEQDAGKRKKFMEEYFETVLAGYRSETEIDDAMLEKLPLLINAVVMENIVDAFEVMGFNDEEPECDGELSHLIKCMEDDIPYKGFFHEIYSVEEPFVYEARDI